MKKLLLPILTVLLVFSACGGDSAEKAVDTTEAAAEANDGNNSGSDSDGKRQALADAILTAIEGDEETPLSGKGECIANAVLETDMADLEKSGLTLEAVSDPSFDPFDDFTPAGTEIVAAAITTCLSAAELAEIFVQGAEEDGDELSIEVATCWAENLSTDQIITIFTNPDSPEAGEVIAASIAKCPQAFIQSLIDEMGIDRSAAECVVEGLSEDLLLRMFAAEDEEVSMEVFGEYLQVFVDCGVDLELLG